MDKVDIYIIIFGALIITLILFLSQDVWAYDYIGKGFGIWNHQPKLCINPPLDQKYLSFRSIHTWDKVWKDYTGDNNLKPIIATIHPYPQMGCDIELVNGNPQGLGAQKKALGVTTCNTDKQGFLKKCIIVMPFEHEDWYGTIQHEYGHSIGLGHRMAINKTGFVGVILSNDIMFGQAQKFAHITNEDINTLKSLYGTDGFKNPETVFIPKNYTIIHEK